MKMQLMAALCSAAVVLCSGASARGGEGDSLRQELVRQGMVETRDGLFEKNTADSESLVAIGPAGNKALLDRLIDMRAAASNAPFRPDDTNSPNYVIDKMIYDLRTPGGANDEQNGSCAGPSNNGGPFHVEAHAGGILGPTYYGASSLAHNSDSGINTTNHASASLTNRNGDSQGSQSTTTYGTTDALATVYVAVGAGCIANSSATITCPNAGSPAVSAIAFNHKPGCILN